MRLTLLHIPTARQCQQVAAADTMTSTLLICGKFPIGMSPRRVAVSGRKMLATEK
ncbi:hypothetical protein JOB18_047933 [Solea senegalensis]|uniref:Uncharacterized protein n=1 Tax=Solea senegalensis TaxID=28829 RepID=A0AAV6SDU3_SOLSE|nr:hypothetical protein JOB18_047933 [Solea senegalensis]